MSSGVIFAPLPDHPVARCKADCGLLAHIIVSKFSDHLPLYRQDGIFAREGVDIPRATQASWLMQTYDAIAPLEEVLRRAVFEQGILFTDDTPVDLQGSNHGRMKKGRLWVYVRGGTGPPLTAYDFSRDRSKQCPAAFLTGYQGYADAYGGYDEIFRKPGSKWVVGLMPGADSMRPRPRVPWKLRISSGELPSSIMRWRHPVRTCPLKSVAKNVAGIFERLEELRPRTIPSEPLHKAIDYAINQKQALCRYLEDGRLRPDNNLAENAIRPVALGRKNWLFIGSQRAGRAAALYMGLIKSCKDCNVNPWEYFDDLLKRIMGHPVTRLRHLLPDQWKPLTKDDHGLIIR